MANTPATTPVSATGVAKTIGAAVLAVAAAAIALALLAPAPASAYQSPAIWVGSPIDGTWGLRGDGSTLPPNHHRLAKASPSNDWAVDLPAGRGSGVYLYAAPSNSAYNNAVTARITQIVDDNACRYGGGGDFVTVGIYYNGVLYGHATYAHLDRNPGLRVGQSVSRWGAWLGNVAWLSGGATGGTACWTGAHVHFEMRASTDYACWNRGYSYAGYPVSRTNFLGFVSGPLARYVRACP